MTTPNYPLATTVNRVAGDAAGLGMTMLAVGGYIHAQESPEYVASVAFGFAFMALMVMVIVRIITGVHTGFKGFRHNLFNLAAAAYILPGVLFLTGPALSAAVSVMAFIVVNYLMGHALRRAAAYQTTTTGK